MTKMYRFRGAVYRQGSTIPDIIPDEQESRALEQQILKLLTTLKAQYGELLKVIQVGKARMSQDPIRWAEDLLNRAGPRDQKMGEILDDLDDLAQLVNQVHRRYPWAQHEDY